MFVMRGFGLVFTLLDNNVRSPCHSCCCCCFFYPLTVVPTFCFCAVIKCICSALLGGLGYRMQKVVKGTAASWLVCLSSKWVVWVHCAEFWGKTLFSHSASLHPGVQTLPTFSNYLYERVLGVLTDEASSFVWHYYYWQIHVDVCHVVFLCCYVFW